MKVSTLVTISLAIFLTFVPVLKAYSIGAGSCLAGQAGVGAQHGKGAYPTYNTQVTTGTLAAGGFKVTIDNVIIKPGVVTSVTMKKAHTIAIKTASSKTIFRGFNIRLGYSDTTALTPLNGNAQANYYCQAYQAVGITHLNNSTKTVASGKLIVNSAKTKVPLDVTIVVQNSNKKSAYYYSGFSLTFA